MSYGARPLGSALGAIVGGLYGAEACLYLAAVIFGAQALVIWISPAVALARQPDMVGEPAAVSRRLPTNPYPPPSSRRRMAKHSVLAPDGLPRCSHDRESFSKYPMQLIALSLELYDIIIL
jgi:hypothetical protein